MTRNGYPLMTTYAYNYGPARISIQFHSPYNSDTEDLEILGDTETRNSVLAISLEPGK